MEFKELLTKFTTDFYIENYAIYYSDLFRIDSLEDGRKVLILEIAKDMSVLRLFKVYREFVLVVKRIL